MNKQEKDLTWKYFWQQKIWEVTMILLIISLIIFIPYILGHNIGDGESTSCHGDFITMVMEDNAFTTQNYWELKECIIIDEWAEGAGYVLLGLFSLAVGGLLLFILLLLAVDWIDSNWKKANKRAKARVRKIKLDAKRGEPVA